ncbi:class I adenylate-forming enzyme family protein [Streptomyces sp. DSM 44915]|uniref:Class I adenylate-forming enzyme family protein n=1 Tax=Streptomyces chisholmiae TaxID=3075540 RepID=A0ABU2JNN1_9ACTN|nr:class I adenylate-forming enzyme family protein [Streptomyces sp. DSM 44915]MDT0266598.1 class I adenylate-forming enzyme family protein [Streptomyces sp. DSM 44915]
MTAVWTSRTGLRFPDHVPAAVRAGWLADGRCPDADLYALFAARVAAHPGREAVVLATDPRGGGWDYARLDAEVRRISGLFTEAGLGAGDVVALRLPNGPAAVAAELAVYAIGAVALPYPVGGGSRDTRALLGRARARAAVFAEPGDLAACAGLPHLATVFTPERDLTGARWLGARPRAPWRPGRVDPAAPARLLVSSGSEAEPKMVAYAHHAMAGGRAAYLRALSPGRAPRRHLVLVSLASSFGSCGVVTLAALGGTLLVQPAFDAEAALRAIGRHRPTHVFGVPTMLRRLAEAPPADADLSSLTALVSSGAELPASTARACERRFRRPVITVYGSSDGVNCHTVYRPEPAGLAGVPDPDVAEIRITDPEGRRLPPGEPGEIQARGPMTPLCYVGDPALDARYRTADGWVRTGDLGRLDEAGRLFLLGRLRNVVIRGGYNISPAEVERELGAHPAIAEAACVPVPDPELGERLCACVLAAPDGPAPALADLNAFLLRDRGLEKRKLPERLLTLTAMPYGPTGKICRRTLTERATAHFGQA